MLNRFLLASLVALSCSTATAALADTTTPPARAPMPPPSNGCLVTQIVTTPVFQIDRKSDLVKDYPATSLVVHSNGAWSFTEIQRGKVLRAEAGCLSKAELATIKQALAKASWKTRRAEAHCTAFSTDFTEYRANDKLVLTSRMCDAVILDEVSRNSLGAATAITNKLVKRS